MAKRIAIVVLVIAALIAWGAWAIATEDDGCVYSTGQCGDPSPGNNPATPIP